jgi:Phospholipid N-methyltransferase
MTLEIPLLIQERTLFLNKFLCSPRQIGSVTPSSKSLAKKMIESVPWGDVRSIAELGSGTGAITKYIQIATGKNTKVLLFETDSYMRKDLSRQYPDFLCYTDACELQSAMHNERIEQLDCIISGLPFAAFPQAMRDKLMEQIKISLKDNGLFIAFQYSLQMKKQLSTHFDIEKIQFVPLNLPPAFVYVCRKKAAKMVMVSG